MSCQRKHPPLYICTFPTLRFHARCSLVLQIIIGASVAGLAAAISLRESGHSVVIVEKDQALGGSDSRFNGCARVPPNGTKIMVDWGLEEEMRATGFQMFGFLIYKFGIGTNLWSDEVLSEIRGDYMRFRHKDLLQILFDKLNPSVDLEAAEGIISRSVKGAAILFGVQVVKLDDETGSVTLQSGKSYSADAIIGADGPQGVVRRFLMNEEDMTLDGDSPEGLAMYSAIIPKASVEAEAELDEIFNDSVGCSLWMGPGRERDLALWLYTPENPQDGTWTEETDIPITNVLDPSDKWVKRLADLVGPTTCVQLKSPHKLESWVSNSGKLLAIGEAAHPFLPGGLHPYSTALEDGSFIGRIFSHTNDPARIPEFFRAFQEHREPRRTRIRAMDQEYVDIMTLADGDAQSERDASFRANYAVGKNAMEGDLHKMLDDLRFVFDYDARDDADEWWINWGRFCNGLGPGKFASFLDLTGSDEDAERVYS
ncbi:hypothetical protein C8F01DRAFT_1156924 [Mycena amicta]|nr:hypothetical protein C8F01DRAFT_1156924 [Mycena amicta]